VLAIGVGCILVIAGAALALVASGVAEPSSLAPEGWFRQGFQEIAWLAPLNRALATASGLFALVAGICLIAGEIRPLVRRQYISAGQGTRREFAVQGGAVERMVRYAGSEVEGVRTIEYAQVRPSSRGLQIACSALIEPDAQAGPLAPLLEARLFNAVYSMTGLPVGEITLRMRHAEAEKQPL
jgi:hypothetical protein